MCGLTKLGTLCPTCEDNFYLSVIHFYNSDILCVSFHCTSFVDMCRVFIIRFSAISFVQFVLLYVTYPEENSFYLTSLSRLCSAYFVRSSFITELEIFKCAFITIEKCFAKLIEVVNLTSEYP